METNVEERYEDLRNDNKRLDKSIDALGNDLTVRMNIMSSNLTGQMESIIREIRRSNSSSSSRSRVHRPQEHHDTHGRRQALQAPRAPQVATLLLMRNHKCKRNNKWNLKQGLQEGTPLLPRTIQVLPNGCPLQGMPPHQAMMVTLHHEDTLGSMSLINHMHAAVENHNNKSTIHMLLLKENYL